MPVGGGGSLSPGHKAQDAPSWKSSHLLHPREVKDLVTEKSPEIEAGLFKSLSLLMQMKKGADAAGAVLVFGACAGCSARLWFHAGPAAQGARGGQAFPRVLPSPGVQGNNSFFHRRRI